MNEVERELCTIAGVEITEDDEPDLETALGMCSIHEYIPEEILAIWDHLSTEARLVAIKSAREHEDAASWRAT